MLVEGPDRLETIPGRWLTQHENWWPDLYREWCRLQRIDPDPHVLAFHTSYETARADLRELSGSG